MIDERWGPDAREFAAALRETLRRACPPETVRAIEADPDGAEATRLAQALTQVGLAELPLEPELLAAAAFELGRAAASAPFAVDDPHLTVLVDVARIAGAAERALELAVEYAQERRQFGVPIGSFQAIAHKLVDTRTAVDGLILLVRKVAWTGPDDFWTAALIGAAVPRAFTVARNTHQVFGGHGFTVEADLQLWTRRLKDWARALPQDPTAARLSIARTLLADPDSEQIRDLWQHRRGLGLPRWARELDAVPTR
ncbi:hypothetical protein GCM10009547_18100 [Sporichthya brevicatena]|uniref:Acyl-CoA dehydrogenase/oxidase C-terminal domain-containing protein n=1 Tax=Sporichthya brevicatena TaxID=171442 RepID=A0ABP3RX68_9ACTN